VRYLSTRGHGEPQSTAAVIARGIASDGGLFVPEAFPPVTKQERLWMASQDYTVRAARILGKYFTEYPENALLEDVCRAYSSFEGASPAPVRTLDDELSVLELWHGPTAAFKDIALQLLPSLMAFARKETGVREKTLILTATSGDTGKAALEGFKDADGVEIMVYYPAQGVSLLQKMQMQTQQGNNVCVCGVEGVFDDTQTGVKRIFTDESVRARLREAGYTLSSANSINFGRLAPQIVYYFSVWCDLFAKGQIGEDEAIDFVVPTGNFGNILAGFYAREMGLPVGRLVCASNRNRVLADFLGTDVYDANREFYTTSSPSMDILISSNLERLLFEASGRDPEKVESYMRSLAQTGSYRADAPAMEKIRTVFTGGYADGGQTVRAIGDAWRKYGYCLDPHTAVGYSVWSQSEKSGRKTVLVSTASPYKFLQDVLPAVTGEPARGEDPFLWMSRLEQATGTAAPQSLRDLREKPVRFPQVIGKEGMLGALYRYLGLH